MEVEEYNQKQNKARGIKGDDVSISRETAEHLIVLLSAVNQSSYIHLVNDSYHLRNRLTNCVISKKLTTKDNQ